MVMSPLTRSGFVAIAVGLVLGACSGPSPDPAFRSETASVNGTRLHYLIGGRGRPVVLLHGFPETSMAWRNVMPALAREHTVVAVDLRGIGGSDVEESGYDKETLATDVNELMAHLQLREVSVVRQDLGGQVAYAYARMYRAEVRSMVVIETAVPGFGLESLFSSSYHYLFHMAPELPERLIDGDERYYLTRFMCGPELDCARASIGDSLIDEYVRAYSRPGRLRAALEYYRAFPRDSAANRSAAEPKLAQPVLALGGEHGLGLLPAEQPSRVAANVDGGVVEGAGHWITEQRPEELTSRIEAFLTSCCG